MIRAALSGALEQVERRRDPRFNLEVPLAVPDVPAALLEPRTTWTRPQDYDAQAARLARMFADNFISFARSTNDEVRAAGPQA
jgi:phosphoenolpyruvate carboxykinase (ATP)